jgi:hypothetical protein
MWRSLSNDTHVVIFTGKCGEIIEADIGGILTSDISKYKGRYMKLLRFRDKLDTERLLRWLKEKQQLSKGYDYCAWLGFATGLKELQDENRWFCSELPYWMFQDNGYKLSNENLTFIYPSDIARNPQFNVIWKGKI